MTILVEQSIDVLLIAGDLYDRAVPPTDAIALMDEVIDRITRELRIPIILIPGNHDSAIRVSQFSRQLDQAGLHILGEITDEPVPVVLRDTHGEVAFYGIPYADPATVRDALRVEINSHEQALAELTQRIKAHNPPDRRCVVLSHCFLDGGEASESERPLSVGGADKVPYELFADFDYAALGHLHQPQYKGKETIRYSGSLLKYSFSEVSHRKSVTIVDMDAAGKCQITLVPLKPLHDMRVIEGKLADILTAAKTDPKPDDYILARLLDQHALFEPMAKLREIYPNILQLEKPNLSQGGEKQALKRENLRKGGELAMYRDFYAQMVGEELDDKGEKIIAELIEQLHHEVDA